MIIKGFKPRENHYYGNLPWILKVLVLFYYKTNNLKYESILVLEELFTANKINSAYYYSSHLYNVIVEAYTGIVKPLRVITYVVLLAELFSIIMYFRGYHGIALILVVLIVLLSYLSSLINRSLLDYDEVFELLNSSDLVFTKMSDLFRKLF